MMPKYGYWLYMLSWILLYFSYLNPDVNTYFRSMGLGISTAYITVFTLALFNEIILK